MSGHANKQHPQHVVGRDDLNLAEFPLALLSDRAKPDQKTLTFQDIVTDKSTGQRIQRRLTITGTDAYGLPTAKDDDVLLGLIQMTKRKNDFTDREVCFSRYELIKLLGWKTDGRYYKRLDESLNRWMSVLVVSDQAWWDKQKNQWLSQKFHVLDNVTLMASTSRRHVHEGQLDLPLSSIVWNEAVFQGFRAGYLKRLRLDVYFGLRSHVTKRMYRYLDKHFHRRPYVKMDLARFAFEHVGMSRNSPLWKVKQKLQPSVEELEQIGFLEMMSTNERYRQLEPGQWEVHFRQGRTSNTSARNDTDPGPERQALVAALRGHGVTEKTIHDFLSRFDLEYLQRHLDAHLWKQEQQWLSARRNPAGELVQSIQENWQPPLGYVPEEERERQKQVQAERVQHQRQRQAEERLEQAKQRRQREHVQAVLSSMTVADKKALEESTLASLTDDERESLDKSEAIPAMRQMLLDSYVERQVLRENPVPK